MDYIYAILAIILAFVILKFILKLSIKIFTTVFIIIVILVTLGIVIVKPQMHKAFNFNIIERVLKFNKDGTTTIYETTTTNDVQRRD